MTLDKPGIYDKIPEDVYHRDPCPAPSLSASIARKLLSASPMHARHEHPKLNPNLVEAHDEKFDRGTAAHAYLLQGEEAWVVIDAPDFKTAKARQLRAEAWIAGKTPLLRHHEAAVRAMAEAARRQLDEHRDRPRPFSGGKAEQTIVWREGDIWCRARLDWLHDGLQLIDDYKSGKFSANPFEWQRQLYNMKHDVQAAFYVRGLRAVTRHELGYRAFRFVPQENFAPFGLSVIGLGPQAMDLAERKVERAIELWHHCLETGAWPGYARDTCWLDLPPWEETRWLEREGAPEPVASQAIDDGRPLADQLFGEDDEDDE